MKFRPIQCFGKFAKKRTQGIVSCLFLYFFTMRGSVQGKEPCWRSSSESSKRRPIVGATPWCSSQCWCPWLRSSSAPPDGCFVSAVTRLTLTFTCCIFYDGACSFQFSYSFSCFQTKTLQPDLPLCSAFSGFRQPHRLFSVLFKAWAGQFGKLFWADSSRKSLCSSATCLGLSAEVLGYPANQGGMMQFLIALKAVCRVGGGWVYIMNLFGANSWLVQEPTLTF